MCESLHAIFGVELELSACLAEFGAQLSRGKDWNVENLAGTKDLLGSGDDLGELMNRIAELFLKIADAVDVSMAWSQVRLSGGENKVTRWREQ